MKKRINEILSYVRPCKTFADIGCDHGKIAVAVLKSGICEKVIASDVSSKSLQKARDLADNELIDGLITVVSDGFDEISEHVDEAVIAGMGGEEIIKILSKRADFPARLILQPMKSADKLRRYLVETIKTPIEKDHMFFDGEKYYDLIVSDTSYPFFAYSEEDFIWGRDNDGSSEDFKRYLRSLTETYRLALPFVSDEKAERELKDKLFSAENILKRYENQ